MRATVVFCAGIVSACASQQTIETSADELEPTTFTVTCQKSWSDCYSQARRICGHGDFDELDRHATEGIVLTRGPEGPRHTVREQADIGLTDRTVTIRCD